jgi:transcriptional regulator GlxA family with amidase domain
MNAVARFTALLSLVVLAGCSGGAESTSSSKHTDPVLKDGAKNVGILIFDGLFITEFSAPFDTYKHTGDKMNVFTVAPAKGFIKTYEGVVIEPDYTIENAPRIDVLVVPSGLGSCKEDLTNAAFVAFVKERASRAEFVTSHCWGAFTLANTGLLDGKPCTTFPSSIDDLQKQFPKVQTQKDARFVVTGNIITSNGGVAAYEAALYVVEKLFGKETAEKVTSGLVLAPQNRQYSQDPRIATK